MGFVSEIIPHLSGVVVEKIDRFAHFGNGVTEGFSGLTHQNTNQLLHLAFHQHGSAVQNRCAFSRRRGKPDWRVINRTFQRLFYFTRRGFTHIAHNIFRFRRVNPGRLTTDIGPVIDSEAKANIERHIQTMRSKGRPVFQAVRENSEDAREWQSGTFVAPTLIELDDFAELQKEVFGPVLHVVRYNRNQLPELIEQINASGYGLTLGVHTRIDETIAQVTGSAHVGNLYVNRNMVGAVVGVQPFGGEGLSGTGPKAGGPLYLYRLLANRPESALAVTLARQDAKYPVDAQLKAALTQPLNALREWAANRPELQALCTQYGELAQAGTQRLLPGPTGERNTWTLLPRERVLCIADDEQDALTQLAAVLAVGSQVLWPDDALHRQLVKALPSAVSERIQLAKAENITAQPFDAVIFHGDSDQLRALCEAVAARDGTIVSVQGFARGESNILLERLYIERSLSVNTAAAGGNASLMTIG